MVHPCYTSSRPAFDFPALFEFVRDTVDAAQPVKESQRTYSPRIDLIETKVSFSVPLPFLPRTDSQF